MLTMAVTSDLHWGVRTRGNAATLKLADYLFAQPPNLLLLAGDIGAGEDFAKCLKIFETLPSIKALVPGNHDIWVTSDDARGDSWAVYQQWLPLQCQEHGFHYLDHGPLILPAHDVAIVGSINWYDGSWAVGSESWVPPEDFDDRLRDMRFSRGRHNDARFVRWHHSHSSFTAWAVARLAHDIDKALHAVAQVVLVTHHPAFRGLNFPQTGPATLDRMLWLAFSGNQTIENLLQRYQDRIALIFSGHTHRARSEKFGPIEGYNVGGDYEWKRLLWVSWPEKTVQAIEFHAEE